MNPKKIMEEIAEYYMVNRLKGHTYAVREGARYTKKTLVVVADLAKGKQEYPRDKFITLHQIERGDLRSHNGPLVMDNSAIYALMSMGVRYMEDLENVAKKEENHRTVPG